MKLGNCIQPWYEFQFDYHNQLRPCCYYDGHLEEIKFNISESWNSNEFKKVREIIQKQDLSNQNGCSNCDYLKITGSNWKQAFEDDIPDNIKLKDDISKNRFNNFLLAKKEFNQKKINLNCLPVKIYINFGVKCNFKCTFCFQNIERENNDTRTISAEAIFREKNKLKVAQEIQLIGGEPLLLKECKKFIELLKTDDDFKNTNLRITTNGSLLNRYLDKLSFFNFLNIELSMEAYGKELEKLRIGAKWEKLKDNIYQFQNYAKENGKNWSLHIPCNIMATTLKKNNLFNLTKWCIENGIEIKFYKINGITKYDLENEDFFKNPKLIKKIGKKNLIRQFDKTIELLEKYQKIDTKYNLLEIKKLSLEAINKLSIKYKINNLKDNLKNDPLKIPKFIYSSILPKKIRYKIGEIRRGKK